MPVFLGLQSWKPFSMQWVTSTGHASERVKVRKCRRLLQRQMAGLDHERGKHRSYVWAFCMHTSGMMRCGVHIGLETPILTFHKPSMKDAACILSVACSPTYSESVFRFGTYLSRLVPHLSCSDVGAFGRPGVRRSSIGDSLADTVLTCVAIVVKERFCLHLLPGCGFDEKKHDNHSSLGHNENCELLLHSHCTCS